MGKRLKYEVGRGTGAKNFPLALVFEPECLLGLVVTGGYLADISLRVGRDPRAGRFRANDSGPTILGQRFRANASGPTRPGQRGTSNIPGSISDQEGSGHFDQKPDLRGVPPRSRLNSVDLPLRL